MAYESKVLSCWLTIVVLNLTLGGWCFHYSLLSVFGKNVSWIVDVLAGALLGQFTIPAAVVCWVMRLCGVEAPFCG